MKEVMIRLGTVDDVKKFVNIITQFSCNFDIVANRYIVDAKSIMGIFSLDLSQPLMLRVESDDEVLCDAILNEIGGFLDFWLKNFVNSYFELWL